MLFHTFLFVFSLRLGGIIIGAITLVKSSIWLILQFWSLECISEFTSFLKDIFEKQNKSYIAEWINLYENFEYYAIALASFYALNILICICLFIGCFQCKPNFMYPFLGFYFIYIILLCFDISFLYLIITYYNDGLEIIIMFFSIAFFVFVFCVYTWCCIYCLIKAINALQLQVLRKIKQQVMKQAGNLPRKSDK